MLTCIFENLNEEMLTISYDIKKYQIREKSFYPIYWLLLIVLFYNRY